MKSIMFLAIVSTVLLVLAILATNTMTVISLLWAYVIVVNIEKLVIINYKTKKENGI